MTPRPLIVGLGSSHGDDQAGWLVVKQLNARGVSWELARTAKNPSELWDWCTQDRALIVCDASLDETTSDSVRRWNWPDDSFPSQLTGTHDFPLAGALSLGVELGCVPKHVTVWKIAGSRFQAGSDPSERVVSAAQALGDRLLKELQCA